MYESRREISEPINKSTHEASKFAYAKPVDKEAYKTALMKSVDLRNKYGCETAQISWLHGVSHQVETFWKNGMLDVVKLINELAFEGANKYSTAEYCERLTYAFYKFAAWDADPKVLGLAPEAIEIRMKRETQRIKERFSLAPFPSEEAFKEWQAKCDSKS